MAALVMTLLLVTISSHGALVLTGVVGEKTSRAPVRLAVRRARLARVPAKDAARWPRC
jgi:hypothetical protein